MEEKWKLQEVARWVSGWCKSEGPDRWEGEGPPVNHASRQKEGRAQVGPADPAEGTRLSGHFYDTQSSGAGELWGSRAGDEKGRKGKDLSLRAPG